MADKRLDEILKRLASIEQTLNEHLEQHDDHDDPPARDHRRREEGRDRDRGCDRDHECHCHDREESSFDERRVVDLIVGLVSDRVEEIVKRCLPAPATPEPPSPDQR